jgi:hypothetical protein
MHTIFIGLSAFLIFAVLAIMNSTGDQYRDYASGVELEQICLTIRSSLEKIYTESNYPGTVNVTYGKMTINLPEQIGNMNYLMKFAGQDIYIESLGGLKNYTCSTRFDFVYNGSTTGGLTEIKYIYRANGTKAIEMSKV